jgi:hypothetical protein
MRTLHVFRLLAALATVTVGNYCRGDGLTLELPRHAFWRGEQIPLTLTLREPSAATRVEVWLDETQVATGTVQARPAKLSVPTAGVKVGPYTLKVVATGQAGTQSASQPITVARRPPAGRLEVWLWGGGEDFYFDHGFTITSAATWTYWREANRAKTLDALDARLARGAYATIGPCGGIGRRDLKGVDPQADDVAYRGAGRREEEYFNPFSPEVERVRAASNHAFLQALGDHPAVKVAFYNSELVDNLWLDNLNRRGVELTRERLGFTRAERGSPKFVAPGVLADDDRGYRFQKYVYQEGSGLAYANRRTAEDVHRDRPDVWTLTDPFRSVALRNTFPGLDLVGTWTYTNNDPKLMLYVETLRAATRGTGQVPLQTVTLLNYPGALVPRGAMPPAGATDPEHAGWMLMGPDRTKEVSWIILSRAPKLLGYYYSSACNPQRYNRPTDQFRVPHATSDAIQELSQRVFKPLGPMITRLAVARRPIAVLSSQAARLYGKSPRTIGYPNEQIYGFYTVMAMAHLNADVLFDEHVEAGDLGAYEVLALPKCDVLTNKAYQEIHRFAGRGGRLIADQYLGPDLPCLARFDFDFTYRTKVNADAIQRGAMFAEWDDHLNPNTAALAAAKGVTAEEDQRIMESYARRLKATLAGKIEPQVELDTPKALVNVLERNGAKYLVLVNDRRAYDDRTGKYKAIQEELLPQSVRVTLRDWTGPLAAYDLVDHRPLPATRHNGCPSFQVSLTELGGKLIALCAVRPAKLEMNAPPTAKRGVQCQATIALRDEQGKCLAGLQPFQVTVSDAQGRATEYSDFYCGENGLLNLPLAPAVNDLPGPWQVAVEDLTAGLTAKATVKVE